jgi:hypothetical protein
MPNPDARMNCPGCEQKEIFPFDFKPNGSHDGSGQPSGGGGLDSYGPPPQTSLSPDGYTTSPPDQSNTVPQLTSPYENIDNTSPPSAEEPSTGPYLVVTEEPEVTTGQPLHTTESPEEQETSNDLEEGSTTGENDAVSGTYGVPEQTTVGDSYQSPVQTPGEPDGTGYGMPGPGDTQDGLDGSEGKDGGVGQPPCKQRGNAVGGQVSCKADGFFATPGTGCHKFYR